MVVTARTLALLTTALVAACSSQPSTPPTAPTPVAPPRTTPPTESNSWPPVVAPPEGKPCGDLGCLSFATPRAAFEYTLHTMPRVVAVGEAHAQKAAPSVESATRRFARDLLPALAPRFKGIVIELLAPDRRCEQHEEQAVAERTKPVTAPQAETNQNEFVALGSEAKKLGIQPEPLIPTCDELKAVLAAQEGDIAALLELIASITVRESFDFLDNKPPEQALAIYGGLLHNDTNPKPDHESWSFGPRVSEHTHGSYVEVDLIVPELIRNEEPWTSLPWFSHYDPLRHGSDTWLYRTSSASFVLIFPKTATTGP
jgi:hypothetical protein